MSQKKYFLLAVGFIFTLITTPLLGLVDTAMMGHLEDPIYIGAVAIGTLIFNTLYWLFGFLRVSTIVFTAQATGRQEDEVLVGALFRPMILSVVIAGFFLLLQRPLIWSALNLIQPDHFIAVLSDQYFSILVWGAPFVLINYVCSGWLMGLARLKVTIGITVATNIINLCLAFLFVLVFGWGIVGVASGTLISQMIGCFLGLGAVWQSGRLNLSAFSWEKLWQLREFKKIMAVNGDLFLRTISLLLMTNLFISMSSSFGTEILAANAILFQLQYLLGNFIDGFANASSILAGRAVGENNVHLYRRSVQLAWYWATIMILFLTGFYALSSVKILLLFTESERVLAMANRYSFWMMLYPLSYGYNAVFYGIFNGVTWSAVVRNSSFVALVAFFMGLWVLVPAWGNDGLWLSFLLFNVGRSLYLMAYILKSEQKLFPISLKG